ncbi:MAG: hypothetical protein AAGD10_19370 [Myxococcota bacterium]
MLTGGLVVPYDGVLVLDGSPLTGSVNLQFELWDDPSSATLSRRVWMESQMVTFFNGRFSVGLGAGTQMSIRSIQDVVQDGEKLYLAIQVEDSTGTLVPLAGRQAIEPAPYAAWSASSADFSVGGRLSVGPANNQVVIESGSVAAPGTLNGGSVTSLSTVTGATLVSSGGLTVTGASVLAGLVTMGTNLFVGGDDLYLGTNPGPRGNGGRALVADFGDVLRINFGSDFSSTRLDGPLGVFGNLGVTGTTNITGSTTVSNLTYSGDFRGWTLSGAQTQNGNGNRNLGVTETQGFCFLTRFWADHNNNDPNPTACHVFLSGGTWFLNNNENRGTGPNGGRGDVDCEARCITF